MIERPSFDKIFLDFSKSLSSRSTCSRAKVGCIIVTENNANILSMGYNGGAAGVFNDCLSQDPGKCGHLHAEINALIKMDYNNLCRRKMYSTTAPCFSCATAIINAGIYSVLYETEYRTQEGVDLLRSANISIVKLNVV